MVKIQIISLTERFIEIKYNDLSSQFGVSRRVLNKFSVDVTLTENKDKILICFSGTTFSITQATLAYIDTAATTVEQYYEHLLTLL